MPKQLLKLEAAQPGEVCAGFLLVKKEHVASNGAELYTLRHEKTGAELLYFDRADENRTFAVSFKTLPEDDTGVFHILEHSVLNGSRKYPVKEPFVSLLQSSMQTFLNALTFSDKTAFPVSSRNEQDLFNLMKVYLDAVFCPLIYERPEIFLQEGWHYEFDGPDAQPYYNGVVYSEMKGAYADVDRIIGDETDRLLFPDNSYGYSSGGRPEHIPELTYEKFVETHRRFYHPSNAKFVLDGHMDIDAVLAYIDGEYLSKYDYRAPDFDFVPQKPVTAERTVCYEAQEGEEELAHMAISKILCTHDDVEKLYAAKILADYLTGSNEAPLKRAFLEEGLAQDVSVEVNDGVFQPTVAFLARNTAKEQFTEIRAFLPEAVRAILTEGLNREALLASLERFAFSCREIHEPYGVELAMNVLDGWLYGDDPLTHIDNGKVFDALRAKVDTAYFADLLTELFADPADKCYLYVLPSLTKGQDDAAQETARVAAAASGWSKAERSRIYAGFEKMQQWQQNQDTAEALATLPHLNLADVPETIRPLETEPCSLAGTQVLKIATNTNGIVYLNLYFDVSDLSCEDLQLLSLLASCIGELRTERFPADVLQAKIKAAIGTFGVRLELASARGDLNHCKPYLAVSAAMLRENVPAAAALLQELLTNGRYDETDRIYEIIQQNDYFLKQSLIAGGHVFAITKALSAFSAEGAYKELLEGEQFIRWFGTLAADFEENAAAYGERLQALADTVFVRSRLFAGFGGDPEPAALEALISSLPEGSIGAPAVRPVFDADDCTITIPGDVGYSALGHNLYALGGKFSGACAVLSSLMTFGYLWNMVRVQGGAYGTGMNVRTNGDIFCYSYRDPNLKATQAAYGGMADFLEDFLAQGMPLDDIIIGTVNTTDPLLDPSGVCELACIRRLKGTTPEMIAQIRREILHCTAEELQKLSGLLRAYLADGHFCAVGNAEAVAFVKE